MAIISVEREVETGLAQQESLRLRDQIKIWIKENFPEEFKFVRELARFAHAKLVIDYEGSWESQVGKRKFQHGYIKIQLVPPLIEDEKGAMQSWATPVEEIEFSHSNGPAKVRVYNVGEDPKPERTATMGDIERFSELLTEAFDGKY